MPKAIVRVGAGTVIASWRGLASRRGGGVRGVSCSWSAASRRRLLQVLADLFPSDCVHVCIGFPGLDAAQSYQQLRLLMRGFGYVWKREVTGKGVFHYHCVTDDDVARVVLSRCIAVGLRPYIKETTSARYLMGEFLGRKSYQDQFVGRRWGVVGLKREIVERLISIREWSRLVKLMGKILLRRGLRVKSRFVAFSCPNLRRYALQL